MNPDHLAPVSPTDLLWRICIRAERADLSHNDVLDLARAAFSDSIRATIDGDRIEACFVVSAATIDQAASIAIARWHSVGDRRRLTPGPIGELDVQRIGPPATSPARQRHHRPASSPGRHLELVPLVGTDDVPGERLAAAPAPVPVPL